MRDAHERCTCVYMHGLQVGDRIVSVNGCAVDSQPQCTGLLRSLPEGLNVEVLVMRSVEALR